MRNALIILGLVVGAVILATGGCEWMDGPAGTEIKSRVRQFTTWDERAIVKDPAGFMTYAIEAADKAAGELEAARLGLRRQVAQTETRIAKNAGELTVVRDLCNEYREAYKAAHGAGQWPVTVGGVSYDEPALRGQLESLFGRHKLCLAESKHLPGYRARLAEHSVKIEQRIAEARSAKADFARQLELVRMNKAIENLEELQARVGALAADAQSLSGEGITPSVDQLVEMRRSATAPEEFEKMLNRPLE